MFIKLQNSLLQQYAIVIAANLTLISVGMNIAWTSPVLVKLRNSTENVFGKPITETEGSWIVSIGSLIGIIANFLPALLMDRIGRKQFVILSSVPRIMTTLIYTFATEVWMLLFARAIAGCLDIMIFASVPTYASEIASKEIRGSLGTILQISCSIGVVLMLSVGPFVSYVTINVICTALAVLASIPLIFIPDSPYFLYTKGKTSEAINILTKLRGSETEANDEIKEYNILAEENIDKKQLFKNKLFLKSSAIAIVIALGCQLTGFNNVTYYLQTIFESTQTSIRPEMASVIIGSIQLFASFGTTIVTDRFGRKPILCGTLTGLAVGMFGLGTFFMVKENHYQINGFMNLVPLVSLVLVVYCYSAGVGSLAWVLYSELFDGPSRAIGLSIVMFGSSVFGFITAITFPPMIQNLGTTVTYWIFTGNTILLSLFILFCVPETKGRTFADIQKMLGKISRHEEPDVKI